MTLNDMFQQDAEALTLSDDDIKGVAGLAKRAKELNKEIEDLEKTLSERKDNYRKLTEESLPEALASMGMSSFRMDDGSSIEIKPFYGASIKAAIGILFKSTGQRRQLSFGFGVLHFLSLRHDRVSCL